MSNGEIMPNKYYILARKGFHQITEVELDWIKLKFIADEIFCGDDFHKMDELYDHRNTLFAVLLNFVSVYSVSMQCWKSKLHSDGTMFEGGYFIAGIETHLGQITYHMKIDNWWDKFHVTELKNAPHYDGHTPEQVIERLLKVF